MFFSSNFFKKNIVRSFKHACQSKKKGVEFLLHNTEKKNLCMYNIYIYKTRLTICLKMYMSRDST